MDSFSSIDDVFILMEELNPKAGFPSDMRDAVIGIVERSGMHPQILMDKKKCIEILMNDGMSDEEATEFFEVNTIESWLGADGTPCFAILIRKDE